MLHKKNGSMHMCVNYCALNALTIKNKYPLPKIDELFDQLLGACYFTKIDLRLGYHQVRIKMHDISKMVFRIIFGHFEFLVMPFGLTNALATFMTLMDSVSWKICYNFLDDILIYSRFKEEHIYHLSLLFELLRTHKLYAKKSKYDFFKDQIQYLGHIITKDGLMMDPAKVEALMN